MVKRGGQDHQENKALQEYLDRKGRREPKERVYVNTE